MTPEQLSEYNYTKNDIVFTENTAEHFFKTKDVSGRRCWSRRGTDTTYVSIIGVVGTFRAYSEWRPVSLQFCPMISIDMEDIDDNALILLRLKEGVSMERFLHDFKPWMVKELREVIFLHGVFFHTKI